jgi:hypothetical protein
MVGFMTFRLALFLAATWLLASSLLWAADAFISKVSDSSGNYCHLRFPAIREGTLYSDRPVLKDPNEGDIVDFYGPCNHDPLGTEEVRRQRDFYRQRRLRQMPEGE